MKNKKTKLVLRIIALVLVCVFVGFNLYLWNSQTMNGNIFPMPFGVGAAIVLSGSMEPTLQVDDLIVAVRQDTYCVGDIVVYQSGSSMVVHRIIAMEGESVTTQGDANNTPDTPILIASVKGKVVIHISKLGILVRILKTPTVAFSLMALAIYLMERSFRNEKDQEKDKIQKMEEEIQRLQQGLKDN